MTQDTSQQSYSISELAKEFDVTTRSIRFYEDQGLLSPTRKGQTRIYSQGDRVRLKLILRGKRLGFSLAETGRLFALYDSDKTSAMQLESILSLIADKKADLQQKLADINESLEDLSNFEQSCKETLSNIQQA
ncbi:MerR family transcriptional regulator [Thalassotalea agarivorans]|uniref:DNA-binding transcriptional regulator, MerR family n=1 Tax=Thalassotalea agarivorans TaxID=349064 RepID=A0A1I0I1Q6_THASX|nr:MerR family DNA-binding transcriptional regulator [Thalassotalea agarivorans]SET89658.1 DNA-binding transcriptional regulator, MerR family [Thalassotalea agarivorans]